MLITDFTHLPLYTRRPGHQAISFLEPGIRKKEVNAGNYASMEISSDVISNPNGITLQGCFWGANIY